MGREPLPQQVAEALAKIPHRMDCNFSLSGGFVGRVEFLPRACSCDREARIAEAVARAIEAAAKHSGSTIIEIDEDGKVHNPLWEQVLGALSGVGTEEGK